MRFFRRSPTRSLTGARLELASGQRHRRTALLAVGLLLAAALLAGGLRYFESHFSPARRAAELERENAALRAAVDRDRLALEMEKATRLELEKQLGELNDKLKALQAELVFYKSQGQARP